VIDLVRTGSDSDRVYPLEGVLSADFQQFDNLFSEAAFASYLLAFDATRDECFAEIRRAGLTQFAEGDDDKKKGKRKPPFDFRFDVPPQEAIDFFKRKKILPPDEFYRLEAEARAGAFTISHVYKTDVIEGFRTELVDAMENGRTGKQTIDRLRSILEGAGHKVLSNHHLEIVVRTMMHAAFGVGRRRAQEDVADVLPIWEYSAVGDDRTRPTHMALDGMQFPADHRFWDKYYPPWDWRCRCSVIAILDRRTGYDPRRPNERATVDLDKEGLPIRAAIDGQVVRINTSTFQGIPRQTSLEQVLKSSSERALDSRK